MLLDNSTVVSEDGYFVSEKMMTLAQILQDYDPYLSLEWIPTDKRVANDNAAPYRIVHTPPGRPPYVVMFAYETDVPEHILARIFENDNTRGNPVARMDLRNAAVELFRLKKWHDQLEESTDKAHFLLTRRSKNYVNMVDEVTGEKYKLDAHRFRMEK